MQKRAIALCSVFAMGLMILAAPASPQQDKSKRPSPPAHTDFTFADGKTITVDYSSPRVKGRKIFGDLEPYGKPWRAGANEATTFVTNTDLIVGGKPVATLGLSLVMLPAHPRSLLSMVPTAFARAALFKASWVGTWTFWVLAAALLAGFAVAAAAVRWALAEPERPSHPEGG